MSRDLSKSEVQEIFKKLKGKRENKAGFVNRRLRGKAKDWTRRTRQELVGPRVGTFVRLHNMDMPPFLAAFSPAWTCNYRHALTVGIFGGLAFVGGRNRMC